MVGSDLRGLGNFFVLDVKYLHTVFSRDYFVHTKEQYFHHKPQFLISYILIHNMTSPGPHQLKPSLANPPPLSRSFPLTTKPDSSQAEDY